MKISQNKKTYKKLFSLFLIICIFTNGCGKEISDSVSFLLEEETTEENTTISLQEEEWTHLNNFSSGGYYYNNISDIQQITYEHIYQSIVERNDNIICPMTKEDIRCAYESILYDHPEIFYCDGYTLSSYITGSGNTFMQYSTDYNRPSSTINTEITKIESYTNKILSKIPYDWSDYDKVQYLYEYIVANTTYQINSIDSDNIISVFNNGTSVCEGYSKAFKYLCDRLQIECIVVTGYIKSSGTAHMWNEINLDGNWYAIDVTWGDTDFENNENTPEVRYDYLCVTTDKIINSHGIDSFVIIPDCVDIINNYYYKHNLYLDTFDKDKIRDILIPLTEHTKITFMCADNIIYDEVYSYLIEDVWIFKYFPNSTNIKYSTNSSTDTFTFWIQD